MKNKYKSYDSRWFLTKLLLAAGCFSILASTSSEVFAQEENHSQLDVNSNINSDVNKSYSDLNIFDNDSIRAEHQKPFDKKGFYVGLGIAKTDLNSQSLFNNSSFIPQNQNNILFYNEDKATSYKAVIGYQFNKNLSIEGGYTDSGKFNYNRYDRSGSVGISDDLKGSFKYKSGSLDLIGHLPVNTSFSWLGIVGTHKGNISNHIYHQSLKVGNLTGVPEFPNKNGLSFKYGLGMQYSITNRVSLRASLERYNFKEKAFRQANTNMLSVNLIMPVGSR